MINNMPAASRLMPLAIACAVMVCGCSTSTAPLSYLRAIYPHRTTIGQLPPTRIERASWYGSEFAGRRTASGEAYDPNSLTAASRTLPLGSLVSVTNPDNGRSVTVRINDHGPYVHGRTLDLSHRAAQRLGIISKGVSRVKLVKISSKPLQEADLE
jgi:rare lipoprotein A (peptidoglycan hydrolase)